MKFNPINYNPVEVRKLKSMDRSSKEYKKAIKNLRYMCLVYFSTMLNHTKPGDMFFPIKKKYKKYYFITYGFLIMSAVPFILGIRYLDYEINVLTSTEVIMLISSELSFAIIITIAMVFAIKTRKLRNRYVDELISQSKIRCPHFSDQLVSEVANAFPYTNNNLNIIKNKERCGCINCLTTFCSEEIKEHNSESVICPHCNKESVISESSGYPITNDFLSAMKEYWIDSTN